MPERLKTPRHQTTPGCRSGDRPEACHGCICAASLPRIGCKHPCTPIGLADSYVFEIKVFERKKVWLANCTTPSKPGLCAGSSEMHSFAWWPTIAVLIVATFTDLRSRRIP